MPAVKRAEIRRMRQELGMKLGPFAKHANVGYKTLANIECGQQQSVSIEVVHLIAKGLGCKPGDILADQDRSGTAQPEDAAA